MQQTVGLLSDNVKWVQPLVRALDAVDVPSRLIPFPHAGVTEFDGASYPEVIFNRVAIRTARGNPGIVSLIRDLLSALELQGKQIINNRHCHQVGSSKALQAVIFQRAGVCSPRTMVLQEKAMLSSAREQMPDGMLKANVGGFGAGAWAPDPPGQEVSPSILDAAFAADGMAVWQRKYAPQDNVIYRVEMLGGEVLYRARVPVEPERFNYCLGNAGNLSGPGSTAAPITLDNEPDDTLRMALADICRLAAMDVGSVEYLIPAGASEACFFDINPVSTYHPQAAALLGFDPHDKVAAWLKARVQGS